MILKVTHDRILGADRAPKEGLKAWGIDFVEKTSVGEIRQVRQNRTTDMPLFNIYFKDTKQTYTQL